MKPQLKSPGSWRLLTDEEKAPYLEAPCGPGKGVLAQIVPDDIWGMDIRPA